MSHGGQPPIPTVEAENSVRVLPWHSMRLASESRSKQRPHHHPFESILNRYLWWWWSIQPSSKRSHSRTAKGYHSQSDKRQDCPALRLQLWRSLHPQCVTMTKRRPHFQQWELLPHLLRHTTIRLNQVPGP